MASADLTAELCCCICMEIYKEPVTLPCGHNFCRYCITKAWDNQEDLQEYKCPECQQIYRKRPELKRNPTLHNIAKALRSMETDSEESGIFCTYCDFAVPAAKSCLHCETSMCTKHLRRHDRSVEHTLLPPTTDLGKRKCTVHKKILEYYCIKDSTCICASCMLHGEHKRHPVKTMEKASEQKKVKLKNDLERLTLERDEMEKRVQELKVQKRKAQEKASGVTKRVETVFRDFRSRLHEQEKRLLRDISKWEEQTSLVISEMVQQLEVKKEELARNIYHVQELCTMPDPLTVLQDPDRGNICDTVCGDNEKTKIQESDGGDLDEGQVSDTLRNLLYMIKSLQVCTKSTGIFLDKKTAAHNVQISEDMKTASYSDSGLHHPATPGRFQNNHVLSIGSITSGTLSLEVDTAF
ncbi:E3 ubiquitin/ISG15 ligase TRIM25-like [Hyperolius riggenbachi]|uniref:E3 ubiquitin/ISG15 ligase TRIM25-like n=1 Tax=Hyperolius riggenbachi TaxID=752182 RepID=UPI0035A32F17